MLDRRWFRISWRSETQHLLGALHVGLASSVVPVIRRVTFEGFFSRLWRLPAFSRRILPEPVTRNRLPAPECVLFFGISFALYLVVRPHGGGRSCRQRGDAAAPRQASISGSRFSERPRSFFLATGPAACAASRSAFSSASSAARSAARLSFSAFMSTLASAFFLCGPST